MKDETEKLANAFSAELRCNLGALFMVEIVRRNKTRAYQFACATHDFCDANLIMASAWESVFKRPFDMESNSDSEIWNAAWTLARESEFTLQESES